MKSLLLLSFVFISSAFAKPCGLEGSVEDRIKDCGQLKGNFALVATNEKGVEIYKDQKTGLIWGSRIFSDFNHYGSQKACSAEFSGYDILNSVSWRLPTIQEFESAASHGMKSALPNMNHAFWSSTPVKTRKFRRKRAEPSRVYLWDGELEKTDTGDLKDGASVRCVSRG